MTDHDVLRKIEDMFRLNPGMTVRHRPADNLIPREQFQIGLPCDAAGNFPKIANGSAWGCAESLETAFHVAWAIREDAVGKREAA